MKFVKESLFSSAIRSFSIAFFSVIGVTLAFFLVLLIFGAGKNSKSLDISTFEYIVPDTNGKKYTFNSNKPLLLRMDFDNVIGMKKGIEISDVRSVLNETHSGPLKSHPIKGILLYINSPGGGAFTGESIYYALQTYAQKYQVPIYAYVEGLCASAGYMIACTADKIYASNASLIGSIGTYMMFFNVSGTMQKYGVQNKTISRGTDKTAMSPFQPWTQNEDAPYQPLLDSGYQEFVSIVTKARPQVTENALVNTYGARIFTAQTAQEIGYIDGAGYQLYQAQDALAQAAGIQGDYQMISMVPKAKLSDLFKMEPFSKASLFQALFKTFLSKEDQLKEPLNLSSDLTLQ